MEETRKFWVHDDNEDELPLTADEEKKVRRDTYIANRLALVSQSKMLEDIEAGLRKSEPGTISDIEWLRQNIARARQRLAELAPEFADDPTIEQDIAETKRFLDNLAAAFTKEDK